MRDYPKPVYGKGSIYDLQPPGKEWFVVQHNDNSDHGRGWYFFEYQDEARAYCDGIEADPPAGNHFHPAPDTLNVMLFSMQRLHRFPDGGPKAHRSLEDQAHDYGRGLRAPGPSGHAR